MSHEERGLYIALLCLQWGKGGLTDDDIARMATPSFKGSMPLIRSKFKLGADGLLRNERLEIERQKQIDFRAKCSESGKKGADRRWGGYGDPNGVATKTPMGFGTGKDGSPISDLRSPDKESTANGVVTPPVQGDGVWGERIASIHDWYCEQTGFKDHIRRWESSWLEWFKAGHEEDDLKRVLKYLREQIAKQKRNDGSLKLSNLLQPDTFAQDLMLAKQKPVHKEAWKNDPNHVPW